MKVHTYATMLGVCVLAAALPGCEKSASDDTTSAAATAPVVDPPDNTPASVFTSTAPDAPTELLLAEISKDGTYRRPDGRTGTVIADMTQAEVDRLVGEDD